MAVSPGHPRCFAARHVGEGEGYEREVRDRCAANKRCFASHSGRIVQIYAVRLAASFPGITSPDPAKGGEMNDISMNNTDGSDGRLQVTPLPAQRRSGRASDAAMPLRLVQVYLTPVIDEFLRQARSTAIVQGLDVSASAVVRHAMERLIVVASPAEIVELLGSPKGQSQHRRGRPRRLMHSAFSNLCMHNSEKYHALLLVCH